MAKLMHEHHSPKFKEISRNYVKSVNFIFGLILFAMAFFFSFSREILVGMTYHIDAFILFLAGILSIWASMSENLKTIYTLNIAIAVIFFLSALITGIFRAYDMEWVIARGFDYTGGEMVVHTFFGLVFLLNALSCRQARFERS